MIEIEIPGFQRLQLTHLVLDYNGTLAVNGDLIEGDDGLVTNIRFIAAAVAEKPTTLRKARTAITTAG
jgi:hypothetical protein